MIRIQLPPPFENDAGSIQNLTVPMPNIGQVALLHCKAGSRRSSHYHKTDKHYLYILSGRMRYAQRFQGETETAWYEVGPGEMVYTPSQVEHWTEFPEDTVLISISQNARDHKSHEKDVVRVPWPEE